MGSSQAVFSRSLERTERSALVGFFETFWTWLEGQLAAYIGTNTALVAAALEPAVVTLAFAMVRTMGFLSRADRLLAPCAGVVYWAGGDARREP